jgi:hypothetical protein
MNICHENCWQIFIGKEKMKIHGHTLALACALIPLLATSVNADGKSNSADVSLVDAINCKLDAAAYNGFLMNFAMDKDFAHKLGWKKLESDDPSMDMYQLPAPIKIADSYSTHVIGFTPNGIAAILDLADPNVIASKEGIKNTMGDSKSAANLNAAAPRFIGQRVLVNQTEPPDDSGFGAHITIAREISNFPSLPGKTLYGCSYQLKVLDRDGNPLN